MDKSEIQLRQSITDEPGVTIPSIAHDQRLHGQYRIPGMAQIEPRAFIDARERGRSVVLHTPVVPSAHLSELTGSTILLKAENLQRTGAFKIRGAINKITMLGDAAKRGVVAGSAGNHAQALALAAKTLGVACEIFVPKGASLTKIAACRHYGATVIEGGDNVEVAVQAALARAAETGMAFCHPYDDIDIVAGQGTLGLELLEDIDDLATVVIPLGGGGLLSGAAVAIKQQRPSVRIIGVQVEGCDPYVSKKAPEGVFTTLADGIAVKKPGLVTAPLVDEWVDELVSVSEDSVADAMVLLMERSKLLVEGGGAVGVSALITHAITPAKSGSTCIVLSGGNVDIGLLPNLVRRHETRVGRRLFIVARLPDRPGSLVGLLTVCAGVGANVIELQHVREGVELHVRETVIQLVLETRGQDHAAQILDELEQRGYLVSSQLSGAPRD
jgi:threonine dehydratase